MWSIAVPVLATLFGIVAIAFAFLLLSRDRESSPGWFLARRGQGTRPWARWEADTLCILAAGCVLVGSGQYKLFHLLSAQAGDAAEAAAQAEARATQAAHAAVWAATQAQVQSLLQAPFDALTVRVHGPDPFHDRPDACALRLRVTTRAGSSLVTEVPPDHLRAMREAAPGHRDYLLASKSVLDGPTTPEGRAVAAHLVHIGDWQRMHRVEADIVVRAVKEIPIPNSLVILLNDNPPVPLFQGQKASGEVVRHGGTLVSTYRDGTSPADHLASVWNTQKPVADELASLPEPAKPVAGGLGFPFMLALAAGMLLLVIGLRYRFLGDSVAHPGHGAPEQVPTAHGKAGAHVGEHAHAHTVADSPRPPSAEHGATR